MKFTTPIYALIATSAVLAYPQAGQNSMKGVPKDCDANFFMNNIDCIPAGDRHTTGNIPNFENLSNRILESPEEYCSLYKIEKCHNFYNNLMSNATKCRILDEGKTEEFEKGLKFLEIICVTDENNKTCPLLTEAGQKNKTEAVNNTCKSKICTETFLKFAEIVYGAENISSIKGQVFDKDYVYDESDREGSIALAFLQSDYCAAQQVGATNTNTANTANTTNVTNNGNANNSTVTGQQNAQSSGATTMKYSVFGTLLAMTYALL